MDFALENGRIGEMMSGQKPDLEIRIGRTVRIHGDQISGVEDVNVESVVDKDGTDRHGTETNILRFGRLDSLQSVLMDQIRRFHSVKFQQPADFRQNFVFVLRIGIREAIVQDAQQLLPSTEAIRLSLFLIFY